MTSGDVGVTYCSSILPSPILTYSSLTKSSILDNDLVLLQFLAALKQLSLFPPGQLGSLALCILSSVLSLSVIILAVHSALSCGDHEVAVRVLSARHL